jgi:RNA polymerase sigma-70 factor (ECF subfamily)
MKNIQEYSDLELYELVKNRKGQFEVAFAELYNRHSPRVFAYCKRYIGSREEAKDVFQETFESFYKSTHQEREMTNIPAFLLRIARNLCVNYLKIKNKNKILVSYEDYMAVNEEKKYEGDEELLNLINVALDTLPEKYKEMFILREYDGLSYTEIAEVTDEQVSNVKVRIHRAKQKIREVLEPYIKEIQKM